MLIDELVSISDAAKLLQVHPATLLRAIKSEELQAAYRVGRKYYVTKEALNAYVQSQRVEVARK